jgi:nitrogenase molybdenum-iron protein alpha/beta subunit
MLLRHTSNKVADRHALTVNPAKTCQPIGAMYAAFGVHIVFLTAMAHRVAVLITEVP